MEGEILKYMLKNGMITAEDVKKAKESIPSPVELDLLREIHDCYCPLYHEEGNLECDFYAHREEGVAMKEYLALLPLLRTQCSEIAVRVSNELCNSDVIDIGCGITFSALPDPCALELKH